MNNKEYILHMLQLENDFYDHTYNHYARNKTDPEYISTLQLQDSMWAVFQEQTSMMQTYHNHRFSQAQHLRYALKQIQHLIARHRYTGQCTVIQSVRSRMIEQFILIRRKIKRELKCIDS